MSEIFHVHLKILKLEVNIEEYQVCWNWGLLSILDSKPSKIKNS